METRNDIKNMKTFNGELYTKPKPISKLANKMCNATLLIFSTRSNGFIFYFFEIWYMILYWGN
jgi:hypothetical protein